MNYTIEKIENGVATFRYEDGSHAVVPLEADMEVADVDNLAFIYAPKSGQAPACVEVGQVRAAVVKPEPEFVDTPALAPDVSAGIPQYILDRIAAYGGIDSQIEYITENGLEAWQAHVAEIKAQYPAPTE